MIQNLRVHLKNRFIENSKATNGVWLSIGMKKNGQTKTLRMKAPASIAFHHAFLSSADSLLAKSNASSKESQYGYGAKSKAAEAESKKLAKLSLEAARQAIIFNPSSVRAYAIMATSLVTLGRYKEALAPLGMAIALSTSEEQKARMLFARGSTHQGIGNHSLAIADYEKMLSMPECTLDRSIVLVHLGGSYAHLGDLDKGVSLLKKAFSMTLADGFSAEASNAIHGFMLVVSALGEANRIDEIKPLTDLWASWRRL